MVALVEAGVCGLVGRQAVMRVSFLPANRSCLNPMVCRRPGRVLCGGLCREVGGGVKEASDVGAALLRGWYSCSAAKHLDQARALKEQHDASNMSEGRDAAAL